MVICPWTIYQAYGDKRILEKSYPAMKAWVEYCRTNSTNSIRDRYQQGTDRHRLLCLLDPLAQQGGRSDQQYR